jgi:hypothetical protein
MSETGGLVVLWASGYAGDEMRNCIGEIELNMDATIINQASVTNQNTLQAQVKENHDE